MRPVMGALRALEETVISKRNDCAKRLEAAKMQNTKANERVRWARMSKGRCRFAASAKFNRRAVEELSASSGSHCSQSCDVRRCRLVQVGVGHRIGLGWYRVQKHAIAASRFSAVESAVGDPNHHVG